MVSNKLLSLYFFQSEIHSCESSVCLHCLRIGSNLIPLNIYFSDIHIYIKTIKQLLNNCCKIIITGKVLQTAVDSRDQE